MHFPVSVWEPGGFISICWILLLKKCRNDAWCSSKEWIFVLGKMIMSSWFKKKCDVSELDCHTPQYRAICSPSVVIECEFLKQGDLNKAGTVSSVGPRGCHELDQLWNGLCRKIRINIGLTFSRCNIKSSWGTWFQVHCYKFGCCDYNLELLCK